VVQDFADKLPRPKTKELVQALAAWGVERDAKVLIILSDRNDNVYLSARNIDKVRLISATNLNVYDILAADQIVITASALDKIKEVYGE
jgi:large subunit ribosomal protein L4